MDHTLIIGGTGMLREASLHFAKDRIVSVVARPGSGKLLLLAKLSKNIKTIEVDYSTTDVLVAKIKDAIKQYGPIDTAIVWIHDHAAVTNHIIAQLLGKKCRYFHLFGYDGLNKKMDPVLVKETDYRKIVLGQIDGRWLTNHEISQGVIKAVEGDKREYLVGD